LGEYFVLERLLGPNFVSSAATQLLALAWDQRPKELCGFIKRAVSDFPDHRAAGLLQEPVDKSEEQRLHWSELVAEIVAIYESSDHPQCSRNFAALRRLVENNPTESRLRTNLARAEARLSSLLIFEGKYTEAEEQCNKAIALTNDFEVVAGALNNRGIARKYLEMRDEAFTDYSTAIGTKGASDEIRACALNNRADERRARGDLDGAIRDRTELLSLRETTFNRRFIALYRRSEEYLASERVEEALEDLSAIVDTPDIVIEQKMSARLQLATVYRKQGRVPEALEKLEIVINSPILSEGTRACARILRGEVLLEGGNLQGAEIDFTQVLEDKEAGAEELAKALFGRGIARFEQGNCASAADDLSSVVTSSDIDVTAREKAATILATIRERPNPQ